MKKFFKKIAAMAISGIMTIASAIPSAAATAQDYVPTVNMNSGVSTFSTGDYTATNNSVTIEIVDTDYNLLGTLDSSPLSAGRMGGINADSTYTYNGTTYNFSHFEYKTSVRNYVASYNQTFEFYVDPPMTIQLVYVKSGESYTAPTGSVVGFYRDPDTKDGKTFYYCSEAADSGTNITGVRANITFGRSGLDQTNASNSETFSTQAANIYSSKYNNNIQFIVASAISGTIDFHASVSGAASQAQIKTWDFSGSAFDNLSKGENITINGLTFSKLPSSPLSSNPKTIEGVSFTKRVKINKGNSISFNVENGDIVEIYAEGSNDTKAVYAYSNLKYKSGATELEKSVGVKTVFEGYVTGDTNTATITINNSNANIYCIRINSYDIKEATVPATTGTLNVTVKDQNNNILPNATVSCGGKTATTNSSGVATLTGVTAGDNLSVSASLNGDTGSNTVSLTAGSSANVTVTINVTTGTIKAKVQNSAGTAITDATVTVNGSEFTNNGDGTYTSGRLSEGSYTVTADCSLGINSAQATVTAASETEITIVISSNKGTLTVNVTDSSSNGLSGAVVTAKDSSGNKYVLTPGTTTGVYVSDYIPEAQYTVSATFGYNDVVSGSTSANVVADTDTEASIRLGAASADIADQTKINTLLATLLAEDDPSNGSIWNSETTSEYKWSYINGCMITAFLDLYEITGEQKYYDTSDTYQSRFVNNDGTVAGTRTNTVKTSTDLDDVNPGKSLLDLIEYGSENSAKYELCTTKQISAILERCNRIEDGTLNFYHKGNYPHQVWLDGTYMALPYMIQYENVIDNNAELTDVANDVTAQFKNVYDKMRNSSTGLYYHGYDAQADSSSLDYDASKAMSWAKGSKATSSPYKVSEFVSTSDNEGCSSNYWLRAMGWYGMALIDTYEQMTRAEEASGISLANQKTQIANIFKELMDSIIKYQDNSTGLWYQVVDNPQDEENAEYNYLETSGSAAFSAALMKGYNLGVLTDESYYNAGLKAFNGLTNEKLNTTGGLEEICGTAGLGGVTTGGSATGHTSNSAGTNGRGPKYNYRDGSFDYYVSEKLATNDAKGAAPYLMAYAQKILHDQNKQ